MNSYDIKCKVIEEELRSVWPEWHVVGRLGGGTFGDVFHIYRDNYGIRVDSALKVIQVSSGMGTVDMSFNGQDENFSDIPDSLRSEIQIMEALRGAPNIVAIEDFSYKRDGMISSLFVRMELLTSLPKVMSGRAGCRTIFSIREIRKLGRDICTALMYCEKRSIIHRDIKPANLFVDEFGNYKIGDFGVSKRMDTVHVARTMTGIGTISYMAPEVFQGHSYNNTVDIYALGLVLYQLLNNGRMPFLPSEGTYTIQDVDSANYQRLHGMPVPSLTGRLLLFMAAATMAAFDSEKLVIFIVVLLGIIASVLAVLNSQERMISDSWEEIIASGEDGTYIDKYKIGDTKELDLGKEGIIEMELVAFDTDKLADGSGKAPMTWIAKDLLNTENAMNEDETNEGGWPVSDMRAWLRESVLPLFPETVRSNISEVKKYSYSFNAGVTVSSSDTIWIPSGREMYGTDYDYENRGPEYTITFSNAVSRQKHHVSLSEPLRWWLRSASGSNDSSFLAVYSDGSRCGSTNANNECGVAIGFCL